MGIDVTTAARPYAKAAFEYAWEHNGLERWSELLQVLAAISVDTNVIPLLSDPSFTLEQRYQLFSDIAQKGLDDNSRNFLKLLVHHGRLSVLPEISSLYEVYRSEHEKTVEVTVTSFLPLSAEQLKKLTLSLSNRLQSKVTLDCVIDKKLLGGVVVKAGDLVIDGSIRSQLDKMRSHLAA